MRIANRTFRFILVVIILFILRGSNAYAANTFMLHMDSVSGTVGQTVAVDIKVKNFIMMLSTQGTIEFDTSELHFVQVENFGLPGLTTSNFGTNGSASGYITFSWQDNTLNGTNLGDDSDFFSIQFILESGGCNNTSLNFISSPTQPEFVDTSFNAIPYTLLPGMVIPTGGSNVLPSVSITGNQSVICPGANITFTATPTYGGTHPSYQWKKNGSNVGGDSAVYSNNALNNNDSIWVVLTSNLSCVSSNTAISNKTIITVNPVPPSPTAISNSPVTMGNTILLTASTIAGATYQWTGPNNFTSTQQNPSIPNSSIPMSGNYQVTAVVNGCNSQASIVTVAVVDTGTGGFRLFMDTVSGTVGQPIVVNIKVKNFKMMLSAQGTIQFDTSELHFVQVENFGLSDLTTSNFGINGGPHGYITFSWQDNTLNGTSLGDDSIFFSIQFIILSNACNNSPLNFVSLPTPPEFVDTSLNALAYTLQPGMVIPTGGPNVVPSVRITANQTAICLGTNVIFTAVPTYGGTYPSYQWKKNGSNAGSDSATYSSNVLNSNDSIWVVLTSNSNCANPDTAVSNKIGMTPGNVQTSTISNSICMGDSYSFNGRNLTQSGTYRDTLTATGGCDSVVMLHLTVNPALVQNISVGICLGGSYNFNGRQIGSAGVYRDTLVTGTGCDSIVNLTLSINSMLTSAYSASVCLGSGYLFNGRTLTQAGAYTDTLTATGGCDSVVTLHLTVNPELIQNVSAGICSGGSYNFNGHNLTVAGTYTDSLIATGGCDSVVILDLTINSVLRSSFNDTICQGSMYLFKGENITTSGIYVDTLTAQGGCDSLVTLALVVRAPITFSFQDHFCMGGVYSFNGQQLSLAGIYKDTIINTTGCDSIVTLSLTADSLPSVTWIGNADTITNGSQVTLMGGSPSGGSYSGQGVADNVFYPDSAGVGSHVITYTYTDTNGCSNTAAKTFDVITADIDETEIVKQIEFYPNPVNDLLTIKSDLFEKGNLATTLCDVGGRLIIAPMIKQGNKIIFDTSYLAAGIYGIKLNINGEPIYMNFIKVY